MGGTAGSPMATASDAGTAGEAAGAGGDGGAANGPLSRENLKPVLLYDASSDTGRALYAWDTSNSEPLKIFGPAKASYGVDEFSVSPDGLKVAFISLVAESGGGEVYETDVDGANLKRLSGAAVAHIHPSGVTWSKGGNFVLYDTDDTDNPGAPTIGHILDATTGKALDVHGLPSPDETRVAVYEKGSIAVQAIDGSNRVELAELNEQPALSWSADGQMLSIWTEGDGETVFSADGRGVWDLKYCSQPGEWAPQGHWLAFNCYKGEFFVQAPREQPLLISAPDVANVSWRWAPDGSQIAVAGADLQTYTLKTGKSVQVNAAPTTGGAGGALDWSPDGQYLAYSAGLKGDVRGLFVARPDGTDNKTVYGRPTSSISSVVWSPDGGHIAYEQGSGGSWYVASLLGESTFVGNGGNRAWSDDGEFFAVKPYGKGSSIRVIRMADKEIVAPDGPSDGAHLTFGLARK